MELGPKTPPPELNRQLPETSTSGAPLANGGTQFLLDAIAWLGAIPFSALLRYEFEMMRANWLTIVALALLLAAGQYATGSRFALYRGRYTYGSFEEVRAVTWAVTINALAFALATLVVGPLLAVPRSIVLIALPFVLILMLGSRYTKRLVAEKHRMPSAEASPCIIYGAGYLGEVLVRRMTTDPLSKFRPVAFLDDSPMKANLELRGIAVQGAFSDLEEVAKSTGASTLIVAIGRADAALLRSVMDAAQRAELDVKVLPLLNEVLQGASQLADLRSLNIEDLISRTAIDTDVESIAGYVMGRRVLVTGAGGSIGSELTLQLSRFGPSKLVMLDRDETALQAIQIELAGNGLLHTNDLALADIRDRESLKAIFSLHKPEVVFHAAALKHLPLLEQYPNEAWKTNVLGTLNVLEASRDIGVETFVNISTDKAANPSSVLGHSKRVAEKLTAWMAHEEAQFARYVSVRFGNVIGSRGSMLPTFASLIHRGGPLTVTHPEATRYFMTISEACQLVVQAGGIGRPGEVLILDMGKPVRILDVAQRMIELSGRHVDIIFTGLRKGEKLHEVLIGDSERGERPFHKLITHANVGTLDPKRLTYDEWIVRMSSSDPGPSRWSLAYENTARSEGGKPD